MDPVVIKATDLRIRTREIMERVKYKGDRFLVQTFGQPTAIIIGVDEYDLLQREIRELRSQVAGGHLISEESP